MGIWPAEFIALVMTKLSEHLEEHKEEYKPWLEQGEQGRVDLKVLPYLKDIENGVFVEAGALDGIFMSNTILLEDLEWTGLLIEPSHKAVIECKKNRVAIVEECALVSKDFTEDGIRGDFIFDGEAGMGAWSSINHNAYGYQVNNVFHPMSIYVQARTLGGILAQHQIKKVDFLSLDVEGYELEALKGIDFSQVEISYILIEVNLRDYTLEDMDAYLTQFGYTKRICLSGFTEEMKGWDGSHNDYLYAKS